MEETPTLDLHGSITGDTTFDEDKGYHYLNVNVNALNETGHNVNDLFVGFTLPEGVVILNNEDTPPHVNMLNLSDSKEVLVKLPELRQGDERNTTYRIPLMGISNEVVEDSMITVYKQADGFIQIVGQFEGYTRVDYSDMDIEWDFTAVSQIIHDYPGLPDNTIAMNFAFKVGNITINEVDEVKLEFNVPDAIQVREPDSYQSGDIPDSLRDFLDNLSVGRGNLDITWDGNTATILIGDLSQTSGYQGYFSAFGETSLDINQLEGIDVTVTLYKNGEELVEQIVAPFEIVSYEGDDDDGQPGDDDGRGGDGGQPGDDDGRDGDGGQPGGNDDRTGDDDQSGDESTRNGSDEDSSNDGVKVTVEDRDDTNQDKQSGASKSSDKDGLTLPKTATNMYTLLLIGSIILVAGVSFMFFRKRTA